MKIVKIIGISFLIFITLVFSAIGIALGFIFTPAKVTPVITSALNEKINVRVRLKSAELTFFSTFPYLGLKIRNGSLTALPESIHPVDPTVPSANIVNQGVPLNAKGEIKAEAKIKGIYGKDHFPLITGVGFIRDGYARPPFPSGR